MDSAIKRQVVAKALREIVDMASGEGAQVPIGLMSCGSELGREEVMRGARLASQLYPGLKVLPIGPPLPGYEDMDWIETPDTETGVASGMDEAINSGRILGAVALHYPFPLGVSTIGCVQTPGKGRPLFLASTTGTTATQRVEGMIRSAIYGIAVAKAFGVADPSLGVINLEGAPSVQRLMTKLKDGGYAFRAGESQRSDGGMVLRGNDLLTGAVDVAVSDSLTGNVLMKVFSAYTTGGGVESTGWGYGPSVGEGWGKVISIISRASGAMVIANALAYTARMARAELPKLVAAEIGAARDAGLDAVLAESKGPADAPKAADVACPPKESVDSEIAGIDVLSMDDAKFALWGKAIYAEPYMGCTGPVLKVSAANKEKAKAILTEAGFV